MALINVREVYPGVHLGLWQIGESVSDFLESYPWMKVYIKDLELYKSEGRKLEFLAVRALLREMLMIAGYSEEQIGKIGEITHDECGKPLLNKFNISISHTRGFASVIISKSRSVAVDIEYYNDRVERIASKFLRRDEKAEGLDALLVYWCAKETVYKLFSAENLQYGEMRLKSFDPMMDWNCEVENLKSQKSVNVDFELTMEFVLTYAAL